MEQKRGLKTPRSAYLFFCDKYKGQLTLTSWSAKAKELGRMWKEASPAEKEVFEEMAREDRERFERENGHRGRRGEYLDIPSPPDDPKHDSGGRFPKRSVVIKRIKSEEKSSSKTSDSESEEKAFLDDISSHNKREKGFNCFGARTRVTRLSDRESRKKIFRHANPLGPFILFSKQVRETLANENPSLDSKEFGKVIADRWRTLAEQKKENFRLCAANEPPMEELVEVHTPPNDDSDVSESD